MLEKKKYYLPVNKKVKYYYLIKLNKISRIKYNNINKYTFYKKWVL